MTDVWRAEVYLRHADPRHRPVRDLFARIHDDAVPDGGRIRDLGCGHGRLTSLAADRWPAASVVGVDSSEDMLAVARADHDRDTITWVHGDMLADPDEPVDLLLSNAALHWVDDHRSVLARLVGWLRPGGTLALQMPRNHGQPTHRVIADLTRDGRWRDVLQPVLRPWPVAPATWLHEQLRQHCEHVDVWETTYVHELPAGDDPVLEWVSGSVLRPLLAALPDDDTRAIFRAEAATAYRVAYPPTADGTTLLPFTRQFAVASRGGHP